ncbi:MAG TPA: C4-dicarboxylate ABC transporter, partial [Burkholderiales bacterium]|nr:C4-dicarboxylate ABC transporter [Burkholderiales bacterium]
LAPDLKQAIDDNSGRHIAKWAGETWEEVEKPGIGMAEKAGNKFMQIPAAEVAKIRKSVQPEIDKFLADLSKPGFDAKRAYADAQKMVAKYSKK